MSNEASPAQEGNEHQKTEAEEPSAYDWPTGIDETSVWPLTSAIGVGTLYVGVSLIALSYGKDALFPRWPGLALFLGGLVVFLTGLFGWLYHGFVYQYWSRGIDRHDRITLRVAMILFLTSEIATFGAGFTYYFYIRAHPWPRGSIPELLSPVLLVNTVLLLTSSVTMHFAHRAIHDGHHKRFVQLLGVTVFLGCAFLAGQIYEYYEFIVEKGYTLTNGLFASGFFGLTGLHGLHVTLGVVLLSIVLVRGWVLDQYSPKRTTSISTVTMYWHFVDGVWLVLVTTVYVGASINAP